MAVADEYITINSVELSLKGAWEVEDPTPLLAEGSARGSNLIVADADGETFRAKDRSALRVVLELNVFGERDQTGTAHPDHRSGMRDNIEYLRSNLLVANVGLVTVVYTFPDGGTRSADGEVRDLPASRSLAGKTGVWTLCALDLVIPSGKLT